MDAEFMIQSRLLPKTDQSIEYRAGDDGTYEAGWWKGRTVASNKERFIDLTLDGDDVVIDRATGLMWAADGNEAGCKSGDNPNWNTAIDYAEALSFAGFDDWRLPNAFELMSIVSFVNHNPAVWWSHFPNTKSQEYWTSTAFDFLTTDKWYVGFNWGYLDSQDRGENCYVRCVRSL